MKWCIMRHLIWVFTVCKNTCLGVSQIQMVNTTGCWAYLLLFNEMVIYEEFDLKKVKKKDLKNYPCMDIVRRVSMIYIFVTIY